MSESVESAQDAGVHTVSSKYSAEQTVERLKKEIEQRGLTLFAVVDHSGGAHEVGLAMNDTKLLIFGNPRGGTPVMVAAPLAALDLPLRVLVWADDEGSVRVSHVKTTELGRRYGVREELLAPLKVVDAVVAAAVA